MLTLIPVLEDRVTYKKQSSEAFLFIQRDNWVERFSIRFLKQPATRKIKLDRFGSFVVSQIDGQKNVEEIATLIEKELGEEAQPYIPRLTKFFQILDSQEWIKWNEE